jgi:sugar phosphate isomerase/epimerase
MEKMAIGVFASTGEGLGVGLERVRELGVRTVQLHAGRSADRSEAGAGAVSAQFREAGVEVTLVFCGFEGESYASIEAVRETVGLVPEATRAARADETRRIADWAAALGAPGIGIHVGFIPEDGASRGYGELVETVGGLCDWCAARSLAMHLETGQETAPTLLRFLGDVGRENLAVNFDPANMILYGSGEPIEALRLVGAHVRSCHCKDAVWSDEPGVAWGKETPLGEGDVGMERFVRTLDGLGYGGPLTIEREIGGEQQLEDIRKAVRLLERIKEGL